MFDRIVTLFAFLSFLIIPALAIWILLIATGDEVNDTAPTGNLITQLQEVNR